MHRNHHVGRDLCDFPYRVRDHGLPTPYFPWASRFGQRSGIQGLPEHPICDFQPDWHLSLARGARGCHSDLGLGNLQDHSNDARPRQSRSEQSHHADSRARVGDLEPGPCRMLCCRVVYD